MSEILDQCRYLEDLPIWILQGIRIWSQRKHKIIKKLAMQKTLFNEKEIIIAYPIYDRLGIRKLKITKNGRAFLNEFIELNWDNDYLIQMKENLEYIMSEFLIRDKLILHIMHEWIEANPIYNTLSKSKKLQAFHYSLRNMMLNSKSIFSRLKGGNGDEIND